MTNGFENAQRWIDECEKHALSCQQIMMEAAAKCAPFKAMLKEAKAAAKESGISTTVLNAALLERKHLRNAAKVQEKIEDDDLRAELDEFRRKIAPVADLPLFGAALDAAEGKVKAGRKTPAQRNSEAMDSVADQPEDDPRPRFLKAVPSDA